MKLQIKNQFQDTQETIPIKDIQYNKDNQKLNKIQKIKIKYIFLLDYPIEVILNKKIIKLKFKNCIIKYHNSSKN